MDLSLLRTNHRFVQHTHPNDTIEHNIIAFEGGTPPRGNNIFHVSIDVTNLDNQVTFRGLEKIDYINYVRSGDIVVFPDDFDVGTEIVDFELDGHGGDMKITMQSTVAEGPTLIDIQYSETKR